jgi:hypothetical protein
MPLTDFRGGIWIPQPPVFEASAAAFASFTVSAASEKVAYLAQATKAGDIHKIGWRTNTVRTGAALDIRVETINASGQPSGSLWGTTTNAIQIVANGDDNTWFLTTLTADATVTLGQFFALVIVNPAIAPGDLDIANMNSPSRGHFPSTKTFSTSWTDSQRPAVFGIEYSDGTYAPYTGAMPVKTIASVAIDSGTTPDEAGMRFKLPFRARARGFWISCSQPSGNYDVKLYNHLDSVIASVTLDPHTTAQGAEGAVFSGFFSSTGIVQKNRLHRLTILPSTTFAVGQSLSVLESDSAAMLGQYPGGADFYYTQRTDGGSWSDDTKKRPLMGVIFDQIDVD